MIWDYTLTRGAERDIERLDQQTRVAIFEQLDSLAVALSGPHQPPPGTKLLKHVKPSTWRLRVGDWRVVYRMDWHDRLVSVIFVDHRSRVYKRL